jgi:cyclopropane fatty-acyl-phospholipid synthase-like methyltransferase
MNLFKRIRFQLSYLGTPPWDTGISPPELITFIENHSPGKALDIGCGTGTNLITLAKHGWEVTGIDFIPKAIKIARKKVKQAGVQAELKVGDIKSLQKITNSFDLILDIGCFHNLSKKQKAFYCKQLVEKLVPGGYYLLYSFICPPNGSSKRGIDEEDIQQLAMTLTLVHQEIGTDRNHPSGWFTFTK